MKTIIFTGGGSGGHVIPSLTLIQKIQINNLYNISYIGSYSGIERKLTANFKLKYYPILSGKLRRYLSIQNFIDVFKIFLAIIQSFFILYKYNFKETVVFSTGGFVSVPVVLTAWLLRIPVIVHEQTSRLGLANKIASKFAKKIMVSFEDSLKFLPPTKTLYTGYPLRHNCFEKHIQKVVIKGITINDIKKPILFVTGGGNGSKLLNDYIKKNLIKLTKKYFVIHQVGESFIDEYSKIINQSYLPIAFIESMIDMYKLSSLIISRAGAGTVCELLAMNKQSVFIPLKIAQKNEQFHNALEAQKKIKSIIIEEDKLFEFDLLKVEFENLNYNENLNFHYNSTQKIINEITNIIRNS